MHRQGKEQSAIEHFAAVLRLDPANADAHDQLAGILLSQGKFGEAADHLKLALQSKPDSPVLLCRLAAVFDAQKLSREAIAAYRQALKLDPNLVEALNNLAWILASDPNAELRNGAEAVQLAQRACELTGNKEPMLIGTLAAAHAEAGQFSDAVAAAERARQLASTAGLKEVAEKNEQLLELYRAGKPYHQQPL